MHPAVTAKNGQLMCKIDQSNIFFDFSVGGKFNYAVCLCIAGAARKRGQQQHGCQMMAGGLDQLHGNVYWNLDFAFTDTPRLG